jgi:hypothetical protein
MKKRAVLLLPVLFLLAIAAPMPAQAAHSCLIGGPGWWSCTGNVTFSSYYLSSPFRPFQATYGSGFQQNITVNFNPWIRGFRVWANDPDYTAKVEVYILGAGYVGTWSINGDGVPGVFSVNGFGLGPGEWEIYKLVLRSDPNDYINWRLEFLNTGTFWCKLTSAPHKGGGATATTSPFYQGSNFDPFQAVNNGTGEQGPIEINFQYPVYSIQATAVDPDYGGTRMEAFLADGTPLPAVYFDGDNRPGYTTTSTKSVTDSRGIAKIVLIPAAGDYVTFQGLTGTTF